MKNWTMPTVMAALAATFVGISISPAAAQTPGHYSQIADSSATYTFKPFVPTNKASFTFSTDALFTPNDGTLTSAAGVLDFSAITFSAPVGTGTGATEAFTLKSFDFAGDTNSSYDENLTGGTAVVTQRADGFYVHGVSGGSAFEFSAIAPGFSLTAKNANQPFTGGVGSSAPVPEASSMVSFGAMILLGGGLLLIRRRTAAAKAA